MGCFGSKTDWSSEIESGPRPDKAADANNARLAIDGACNLPPGSSNRSEISEQSKETVRSSQRGRQEVETEVSISEVGGPLSTFGGCDKHIDSGRTHHDHFIYVDHFNVSHLPSMCGVSGEVREYLVKYVKLRAGLVVRIAGGVVSKRRPDTWADGRPYLFSKSRGKSINKVGSGWVWSVYKTVCSGKNGCHKGEGEWSMRPCWKIEMFTARHVVYDTTEARTCRYDFFDDKPSKEGCVSVQGDGARVWKKHTEDDYCWLYCYSHDHELGHRLEELESQWGDMKNHLHHLVVRHNVGANCLPVVVVSHPHGKAKHISVGRYQGEEDECSGKIKLYDTPTCPGSSGGLMMNLSVLGSSGRLCWDVNKQQWVEAEYVSDTWGSKRYVDHPHAGSKSHPETGTPVGYSSTGEIQVDLKFTT